jgi:GT2 family glycosyltransferase/glycosyltransferase involved in cell wall biosynthesis
MPPKVSSPPGQPGNINVLDVQERRRPPRRSKEDRDVYLQKTTAGEETTGVPIGEISDILTLTDVREGGGSGDEQISNGSVLIEIVRAENTPAEAMDINALGPDSDRRGLPMGNVDALDSRQIHGWAWHPDTPGEAVDVEFLVGDVVVLKLTADRFRDDLLVAQGGGGHHGFKVDDLRTYLPQDTRSVCVRRASDGLEIPGSPILITDQGPADQKDEAEADIDSPPADEPCPAETAHDEISPDSMDVQETQAEPQVSPIPAAVVRRTSAAAPGYLLSIGNVDRIDYDEISGWAWDPDHPENAIDIEILDDNVVVLKLPADQYRPDLTEVCVGTGHHGFSIRNLGGIFPLSRHRVRVRRASDGLDLAESPAWLTQPGLDLRSVDFIDQVVFTAVQAARKPEDLAQPLGHLLGFIGELINAREELAQAQNSPPQIPPAEIAAGLLAHRARELVETIRYAYKSLRFELSDEPVVSIIIPVHNKFSVTYDCLKSIQEALPKRPFEVIIVDDCSDDETLLSTLVVSGAVHILRNTDNLGFVRTCNAGAAVAKGRYLFFLNNDTLVKEGWLDELVQTFEQVPNIGIAGSRLLFNDGKLQEAGGIVWRLGDAWNWGRGRDPAEPIFSYLRDADWVSGAALMIETALFRDLGGFDDVFAPGYYEDTDLAFRVRALGKRVVVQPASEVVHLEGVSSGTDTSGLGMKRYQVINHAKFYQRWKDTLLTHRFNGQLPEQEAERLVGRRAYFIDDSVPTPDQDAGSNAAVEHMRALIELGYKVTFLPADNMARIDPYTLQLQKIGVECLHYPYYWSVEEVFRKAAHKPDLIYLHRYSNASKYATMVRRYFPECRIVYSVADLHFLRMRRQAEVEGGTITEAQVVQQRRAEMSAMQNVDCVIVHSPVEARVLHEAEPSLFLEVVPWTVRPRPTPLSFAQRSGLAFVGGFGHPPNLDAVRYYVGDIHPLLRRRLPDAKTYLVGSKMPDEITNMRVPGVAPVGFVSVLADVLNKLRLTVVPLRYGAGIKGKVLESFAHGLPCVMSEVAAEGFELPKDLAWLVARTPAEFAEKIARVHEDEAFNRQLSEAGLAYIERRHSVGVVKEALRAAVAG